MLSLVIKTTGPEIRNLRPLSLLAKPLSTRTEYATMSFQLRSSPFEHNS